MRAVLIHLIATVAAIFASSVVICLGLAWIAGSATLIDIVRFMPLVALFVTPPALLFGGAVAAFLYMSKRTSAMPHVVAGAVIGMVSVVGYSLLLAGRPATIAPLLVNLGLFGGAGAIGALVFWVIAVRRWATQQAKA